MRPLPAQGATNNKRLLTSSGAVLFKGRRDMEEVLVIGSWSNWTVRAMQRCRVDGGPGGCSGARRGGGLALAAARGPACFGLAAWPVTCVPAPRGLSPQDAQRMLWSEQRQQWECPLALQVRGACRQELGGGGGRWAHSASSRRGSVRCERARGGRRAQHAEAW